MRQQEWFHWGCMSRKLIKNSGKYFETEISCFATSDFIRRANEEYKVTFHILSMSHFLEVWSTIKIQSFTGQTLDFKNANKTNLMEYVFDFTFRKA